MSRQQNKKKNNNIPKTTTQEWQKYDLEFNKEIWKALEERAGTLEKEEECPIGRHAWFEKMNGAVICYICGKLLYRAKTTKTTKK